MGQRVTAVICDSGVNLPEGWALEHGVEVVPLRVNFPDGSSLASGVDISGDEVVARLRENPTTSLPSPAHFVRVLEAARDAGAAGALVVTIASGLSGVRASAELAERELGGWPVRVVDSKSIGLGAGLVLMEGVRLLEGGASLDETARRLVGVANQTHVFFSVRSLDHLRRGGRISEATYAIGRVLDVKPIITCDTLSDGHYETAGKARGWKRALATQVRLVAGAAGTLAPCRVGVCCSDETKGDADGLVDAVRQALPNAIELVSSPISADLLVHTGPALVGLACQPVTL